MTRKRFTLIFTLLALLTAAVSAHDDTGAADDRSPKGYAVAGFWHSGPSVLLADPMVQEATGLDGEGLRAALLDGSSISDLIAANGGDVESVIAELVAQAAESTKAQAEAAIEQLDASISEALNESHRPRFRWWRRRNPARQLFGAWGMDETITQATGLSEAELNTALLRGETLADLITANNGDVDATVSTLVEQATAGINEAADARIQRHEEAVMKAFEADFSESSRRWRRWRPRHGFFFSFRGVYDSSSPTAEGSQSITEISSQPPADDDSQPTQKTDEPEQD